MEQVHSGASPTASAPAGILFVGRAMPEVSRPPVYQVAPFGTGVGTHTHTPFPEVDRSCVYVSFFCNTNSNPSLSWGCLLLWDRWSTLGGTYQHLPGGWFVQPMAEASRGGFCRHMASIILYLPEMDGLNLTRAPASCDQPCWKSAMLAGRWGPMI